MSVQALGWVFDHSAAKGGERLVLLAIANHLDADGEGWVPVVRVLDEANVSEDTYRRATQRLIAAGELEREVKEGGSARCPDARRPNLYRIPALCAPRKTRGSGPSQDAGVAPLQDAGEGAPQDAGVLEETVLEPSKETTSAPAGAGEEKIHPTLGFEKFWAVYPSRNGRKVGRSKTLAGWARIKTRGERLECYHAAERYAAAVASQETIAKDPERFLAAGYWRDWLADPEPGSSIPQRPAWAPPNATWNPINGTWES